MSNHIIGSGLSGISAAQLGLATTSHNISNVNTPGYSRQAIVQGTQNPQFTGSGFVGRGTNVVTIQRSYSSFIELQARDSTAQQAHSAAYLSLIGRIDALLADASTSVSQGIDDFFRGVNEVAAYPADAAARQSLLSTANALAARFQLIDSQLAASRVDVNRRIESAVSQVNSIATQLADLNQRIALARASGSQTQQPNDLLDQRDALVRDLNKLVRATVVTQDDGSFNVFLASGQTLVVGTSANALAAVPDLENPQDTQIAVVSSGTTVRLRPADLEGGEIGGMLAFRSQTLDAAHNALGRIALGLAQSFNDQHRLGQDLQGALGQALFALGAPQVLPSSANTGAATVSAAVASYSALTTSDYRVRYDGANYTITRLSDGVAQTFAALPQTVDGVTFSIAGVPAANDSFLVQPTRTGARDFAVLVNDTNRVAAAAPIRTASSANNRGSATISAGTVNAPPPPNANLTQTVTITFTGAATFDVAGTGTGNPTGVAYTSGGTITYNGWSIQIQGTPQAGDVFTVSLNAGGVGDNRNARALAAVQTANTLIGGTATVQGAYAQLVSDIGNKTRELQVTGEAQNTLLEQTLAERESVSGVNLDEEAANLLRYQQAYQASAKVLAIASTLFDSILEIARG
jgi:flagellar hook-associated protein 1 FlgK